MQSRLFEPPSHELNRLARSRLFAERDGLHSRPHDEQPRPRGAAPSLALPPYAQSIIGASAYSYKSAAAIPVTGARLNSHQPARLCDGCHHRQAQDRSTDSSREASSRATVKSGRSTESSPSLQYRPAPLAISTDDREEKTKTAAGSASISITAADITAVTAEGITVSSASGLSAQSVPGVVVASV